MLKYLAKRIARSFITLFIVITIVFSLLRLMPIEGYFNNYEKMSPQQIERELTRMGLTDPLPVQLLNFYKPLFVSFLRICVYLYLQYTLICVICQHIFTHLHIFLFTFLRKGDIFSSRRITKWE